MYNSPNNYKMNKNRINYIVSSSNVITLKNLLGWQLFIIGT